MSPLYSRRLLTIFPIFYHPLSFSSFFFFNDTATTEIYTLSLHDALPICRRPLTQLASVVNSRPRSLGWRNLGRFAQIHRGLDRKSTRLNSSHSQISYAVFCLKKKKKQTDGL